MGARTRTSLPSTTQKKKKKSAGMILSKQERRGGSVMHGDLLGKRRERERLLCQKSRDYARQVRKVLAATLGEEEAVTIIGKTHQFDYFFHAGGTDEKKALGEAGGTKERDTTAYEQEKVGMGKKRKTTLGMKMKINEAGKRARNRTEYSFLDGTEGRNPSL